MDNYITVHHVQPRQRTPEEVASFEVFKARMRARDEAMEREAIDVNCPTCKAGPGMACVWRQRHYQPVHSPRLYRTPTWKAGF